MRLKRIFSALACMALVGCASNKNENIAEKLFPVPVHVEPGCGRARAAAEIIEVAAPEWLPAEGYVINITPEAIELAAAGRAGAFYAGQTLSRLNELYPDGLPCMEIVDYPRLARRGLMVDVARNFQTVEDLKKFIDLMAEYRFNYMHFHLTDDQGWRVEIKEYPELTRIGAARTGCGTSEEGGPFFYTQDELRELVAYAAERNIEIIPEIDLPGHCLAALASYPELGCTGGPYELLNTWGISEDILCAGKPATMKFVKAVITELAGIFPSPYIHIGGDECPLWRWSECADCQNAIRGQGLKDELELEHRFVGEVAGIAASRGKTAVGWDELLACEVPSDAVVMAWRGNAGAAIAAKRGHKVISASYSHLYFDYGQGRDKQFDRVGGASRIDLRRAYSFDPYMGKPELLGGMLLGAQANLWAEGIRNAGDLEYKACPRMVALGEVLWSQPENLRYSAFQRRLFGEFDRLRRRGVSARYAPPELPQTLYFSDIFRLDWGELPEGMDIIYTLDGTVPSAAEAPFSYRAARPEVSGDAVLTMQLVFADAPDARPNSPLKVQLVSAEPLAAAEPGEVLPGLEFQLTCGGRGIFYCAEDFDLAPFEELRSSGAPVSGSASGWFYAPETANYEFSIACGGKVTLEIGGAAEKFSHAGDGVFHSEEKSFFLEKGFHPLRLDFELPPPGGHGGRMQLYVAEGLEGQRQLGRGLLFHSAENR